jgi:hypothetical protein
MLSSDFERLDKLVEEFNLNEEEKILLGKFIETYRISDGAADWLRVVRRVSSNQRLRMKHAQGALEAAGEFGKILEQISGSSSTLIAAAAKFIEDV